MNYSNNFVNLNLFLQKSNHCQHLYKHFSHDHSIETDFSFQVFYAHYNYYLSRLETDLMLIFNTFFPCGLNTIKSTNLYSLDTYIKPPI